MMSAAHALIEMPTECGSTTARNGQQYLGVLPSNPLAISLDEGSSSSAEEIGNLERRRGHWGTSSSNVTQLISKTAGRSLLRSSCVASAAGRLRPNEVTFELILARLTGSWLRYRIKIFSFLAIRGNGLRPRNICK